MTNALLAIAVAEKLGMSLEAISQRLKKFHPPERTFRVRTERGVKILDDTYNASPDSFRAAIAWTQNQPQKEKILVFSGIIELGKEENEIHRSLGESAKGLFSKVYVTNKKYVRPLSQGLDEKVEYISDNPVQISTGGLLVCIGRMELSTIEKLLP